MLCSNPAEESSSAPGCSFFTQALGLPRKDLLNTELVERLISTCYATPSSRKIRQPGNSKTEGDDRPCPPCGDSADSERDA
ncbi:MAG: hypothetical protein D3906_17150 [Candidatus Electrothrix sp. AUS1_2]|nr:hypothetical protein [Candidatus Electrothrix sp. AUS1_2]